MRGFGSYSTNRLADVSWGQRAVESGIDEAEMLIVRRATLVNRVVRINCPHDAAVHRCMHKFLHHYTVCR